MVQTLKLFGYIALFFVVAALLLLAVIMAASRFGGDLGERPGLLLSIILGALIVIGGGFVPWLNFAMRNSYVYEPVPGTEPLGEAELRAVLMSINGYDVPVAVTDKGRKLVVHWNYIDGEVWGLLEMRKIRQSYELEIRLDGASGEAILTDVKRSMRLGAGPYGVRLGMGFTRGYLEGVEIGHAWGIRRDFSFGKAYAFKFNPQEIKRPVLNTILQSGWKARFAMW